MAASDYQVTVKDYTVTFSRVCDGKVLDERQLPPDDSVSFWSGTAAHPDGACFALGHYLDGRSVVSVWYPGRAERIVLDGCRDYTQRLQFSPSGQWLLGHGFVELSLYYTDTSLWRVPAYDTPKQDLDEDGDIVPIEAFGGVTDYCGEIPRVAFTRDERHVAISGYYNQLSRRPQAGEHGRTRLFNLTDPSWTPVYIDPSDDLRAFVAQHGVLPTELEARLEAGLEQLPDAVE